MKLNFLLNICLILNIFGQVCVETSNLQVNGVPIYYGWTHEKVPFCEHNPKKFHEIISFFHPIDGIIGKKIDMFGINDLIQYDLAEGQELGPHPYFPQFGDENTIPIGRATFDCKN